MFGVSHCNTRVKCLCIGSYSLFLYDIHANIIIISFKILIFCTFSTYFIEHYPIINNNNNVQRYVSSSLFMTRACENFVHVISRSSKLFYDIEREFHYRHNSENASLSSPKKRKILS